MNNLSYLTKSYDFNRLISDYYKNNVILKNVKLTDIEMSLFISGIMNNIPIPKLYTQMSTKGVYNFINGSNIITSVLRFYENSFKFNDSRIIITECSNHYFKDIPIYYQNKIIYAELTMVCINPSIDEYFLSQVENIIFNN